MNQAKKVEHEESTADALPEDSDNNLPAEARAFVSAVDAVCAWTTGAKYLLKSEITKSPAPLIISLLDLPRGDIKESTPNALLNRWQSVASELWSNDNQDIAKKLREFQAEVEAEVTEAEVTEADKAGKKKARVKERKAKTESAEAEAVSAKAEATEATTTEATSAATEATTTEAAKAEAAKADAPIPAKRGQCHCEAALISSIYLRRKDLNDLPAEKREPTVVASAFKNFSPDMSDSFTVGVAKKCCPICKLVVTALRGWQIDLNISGAHSRYHPWVPPQWLPDDIIIELEIELIKRVSALLVRPSRASSPTGDSDKASIHIYPEKFPKPPKATRK
ncbi:hypothetical protein C8F01DRAFT_657841 [Mycena amicta]|nr:hypothetical protein C8F01DRAFT_657841 [Mycena amicta]